MNSLSLMNIIKKLINLLLSKAKKSLQWFLILFSRLTHFCKLGMHQDQDQDQRVCDDEAIDKSHDILNIRHTLYRVYLPENNKSYPSPLLVLHQLIIFLRSQSELLFHTHALDLDCTADLVYCLLPLHLLMKMGTVNLL